MFSKKEERSDLMMLDETILETARRLEGKDEETLPRACSTELTLPDKDVVIEILRDLRKLIFPGYFGSEMVRLASSGDHVARRLKKLAERLLLQVEIAYAFDHCRQGSDTVTMCPEGFVGKATEVVANFLSFIPDLRLKILKDIDATFHGDPAANSREEVIFSYPGAFAILVYRVANNLFRQGVPFLPRMMTEYAHSRTGIDISAGAAIGEHFMIDHGTGVVIGETSVIGDHCKIYQGVTLGALSTRDGRALEHVKRHPTIGSHVTIYANATILGGETVIGDKATIGGNAFIIKSVAPGAKVSGLNGQSGN